MFLERLSRIRKTITFRLIAWYSAFFVLSISFLFLLAYFLLSSSVRQKEQEETHQKLDEYAAQYQTGRLPALQTEVGLETRSEKENPPFVRVSGPRGETLFLNAPEHWREFDLSNQLHRFVASDIWNLPFGKEGNSFGNRLVRHWRVSNIFTAQSGRPFGEGTFVVTGIPFAANGMEWNGFGFNLYGQGGSSLLPSVPRNNHSGAGNYTLDMRVSREFHIKEKYVLELLGKGFNLFNHSNFNQYNSTKVNVGPTIATTDVAVAVTMSNVATFATPFGDGGPPDGTNARRFQLSARFRF